MTKKAKRERLLKVREQLNLLVRSRYCPMLNERMTLSEIEIYQHYTPYELFKLSTFGELKKELTELGIYSLWLSEGHTWSEETYKIIRTITQHVY